jgi:hypothetical protein
VVLVTTVELGCLVAKDIAASPIPFLVETQLLDIMIISNDTMIFSKRLINASIAAPSIRQSARRMHTMLGV